MNPKLKTGLALASLLVVAAGAGLYFAKAPSSSSQTNIDDASINWNVYNSSDITLSESLTITKGGTYTLTGTLADGMVTIDTDKDVKLILNGVTITNSNGPAIYVKNADNVVIETVTGTVNTLTDSATRNGWEDNAHGTIYSHDDLVFQGEGSLIITGKSADGIVSNDDLKITSGTIEISAADDGIHVNETLEIDGGVVDIKKSYEGLEASSITINDGQISVMSNDDGLNAAGGNDASSPYAGRYAQTSSSYSIVINGGSIYVNAAGDGIDSNGTLAINGGTVIVDGPTNAGNGALDAEGALTYNGGSVIAVGATGMAVAPGASSSGYSISAFFSSTYPAGSTLTVKDSSGNTLLEHTSKKAFSHAALSSESFREGNTYIIYIDGAQVASITLSGKTTQSGSGGMGGPGGNMAPGQRAGR